MKTDTRKELIQQFMHNQIGAKQLEVLKKIIDQTDDKKVAQSLEELWDNYDTCSSAHQQQLDQILQNIKRERPRFMLRKYYPLMRYAAILLIFIATIALWQYDKSQTQAYLASQEVVFSCPSGQRANITLPDGTQVEMNSNSRVSYYQTFGQENREITFEGEAYFSVAKDKEKRFIINTADIQVEVVGTSFNLFAYPHNDIVELALEEGAVNIYTKQEPLQRESLQANEKVIWNRKTHALTKHKKEVSFETAWKEQLLQFDAVSLAEVFETLSRKFGVTITYPEQLNEKRRYSASFTQESLYQILEILKIHYHFDYEKVDNEIIIQF